MGKNIKTLRRFLALVMAFGVVAGLCACTQQSSSSAPPSATSSESQTPDAVVAEWPDFLTVGGGSTGGVFFSAAAGIAQLLSSETDTTATAQTTTGGSQNIQLIANGEMELGIAAADACYQAWNGIGSYEKPLQEMNVICAIYSSYYQHVVRNDSKAQSFEEMAGSTQVVGGSGSGTEVSARAVLGAYGYDYLERKDLKAEFLGISEGVEKIQNKQADGMNSITPYPFSSFVELTMTDNAHLISINDEALDKLVNAEGSVYMKGIIPAGTYNNQNEDIQTICMPTFLICDKDMDEQLVYEITKLMIENEDYLCSQHSCFEAMNDDTVAAGLSTSKLFADFDHLCAASGAGALLWRQFTQNLLVL